VTDLKSLLTAAHPVLAAAAAVMDVKSDGGLNIEAIDIAPDSQQLLIGLRRIVQPLFCKFPGRWS